MSSSAERSQCKEGEFQAGGTASLEPPHAANHFPLPLIQTLETLWAAGSQQSPFLRTVPAAASSILPNLSSLSTKDSSLGLWLCVTKTDLLRAPKALEEMFGHESKLRQPEVTSAVLSSRW